MKTRGRRSKKPSSHTHRVARSYAANMGKRLVQIEDKDRLLAPIIEVPEKGKPVDLLWHVGTTLPRQERKAHGGLTEFGAVVFAPMQVRWAHYARDKRAVERALFPGYVFIGLRPGQGLQASQEERQRMGVSDILYLTESQSRALASFLFQIACRQAEGEFDDDGTVKGREAGSTRSRASPPASRSRSCRAPSRASWRRSSRPPRRTAKVELPDVRPRRPDGDVPLEDLRARVVSYNSFRARSGRITPHSPRMVRRGRCISPRSRRPGSCTYPSGLCRLSTAKFRASTRRETPLLAEPVAGPRVNARRLRVDYPLRCDRDLAGHDHPAAFRRRAARTEASSQVLG
jgi:hypothetical protein